jgi:hypothetical protein
VCVADDDADVDGRVICISSGCFSLSAAERFSRLRPRTEARRGTAATGVGGLNVMGEMGEYEEYTLAREPEESRISPQPSERSSARPKRCTSSVFGVDREMRDREGVGVSCARDGGRRTAGRVLSLVVRESFIRRLGFSLVEFWVVTDDRPMESAL